MLAIYLLINSLGTFLQLRGQATIISHDTFIIALDKHKLTRVSVWNSPRDLHR